MKKQIRDVRVIDFITHFILTSLGLIGIWVSFPFLTKKADLGLFILILVVSILLTVFVLKYFMIGLVLLYKIVAPQKVRDRCRFEPTCSTYMIMSINKYGVIVGVIKGIKRLLRCKPPHGGIDLP